MKTTGFANHVAAKRPHQVPVSQPLPGRPDMVKRFGNFTFALDPLKHVERFLILGTSGGTYYATEKEHTMQAFDGLMEAITENGMAVLDLACKVSNEGRAKSNDPALFVLAAIMAYGNDSVKAAARLRVREIARIGTHILHLAEYHKVLGKGWGKSSKKLFQAWFLQQTPESLATNVVKFYNRDGWNLRDVLRLSHPFGSTDQNRVFKFITNADKITNAELNKLPPIIRGTLEAKTCSNVRDALKCIREYKLPREAIPTEFLNDYRVWEELLPHMGITALIRNLGKMSSLGMLEPLSDNTKFVCKQLVNAELLSKGRVHPITLLNAQRTYKAGQGMLGNNSWKVTPAIVSALEKGFYESFQFVEPTGLNLLLAIDCSASMTWSKIAGTLINPREAAGVLALVTAKREKNYHIMGFSNGLIELDITADDTIESAVTKIAKTPAGNTRTALPIKHALEHKWHVDCFHIYTDNETNIGEHPSAVLKKYRQDRNSQAKLAVFGMTATKFTIADPKDLGMMDFVGFDSGAPQAAAEFAKMKI